MTDARDAAVKLAIFYKLPESVTSSITEAIAAAEQRGREAGAKWLTELEAFVRSVECCRNEYHLGNECGLENEAHNLLLAEAQAARGGIAISHRAVCSPCKARGQGAETA